MVPGDGGGCRAVLAAPVGVRSRLLAVQPRRHFVTAGHLERVAFALHRGALEGDDRELLGVEEVRALEVLIALLVPLLDHGPLAGSVPFQIDLALADTRLRAATALLVVASLALTTACAGRRREAFPDARRRTASWPPTSRRATPARPAC